MTRREFLERHGLTCRNWRWSWSFVNHEKAFVVFGAWDDMRIDGEDVILSEDWERTHRNVRSPSYPQSREHIALIEKGYALWTFEQYRGKANDDPASDTAKMLGFRPVLSRRVLVKRGREWRAAAP